MAKTWRRLYLLLLVCFFCSVSDRTLVDGFQIGEQRRWTTSITQDEPNNLDHLLHLPIVRYDSTSITRASFIATVASMTCSAPLVASAATTNSAATTKPVTAQLSTTSETSSATSSTSLSSEPSSWQESISGFVAGAALAGTKTLVKFPLDTATVRLQMPNSKYSIQDPINLFDGCFNGVTFTLLSNIPAGAVFFAVKDATKASIKNSIQGSVLPRWLSTSLAVAVAQFPYWIVRNPSEVVKVRQQANIEGYGDGISAIGAIQQTLQGPTGQNNATLLEGISEFYTGYWENILYAYPADVIKFVAYEAITKGRKDLSPLEGAEAGSIATALAQLLTTPLDVVRNRLMTGRDKDGMPLSQEERNKNYLDSLVSLGRQEGIKGLFAGSSPRVGKAFLSGAIQFATYEETKQSITKLLQGK